MVLYRTQEDVAPVLAFCTILYEEMWRDIMVNVRDFLMMTCCDKHHCQRIMVTQVDINHQLLCRLLQADQY